MALSSAKRVAAYRARQREAGKPDSSRRYQAEYNREHKATTQTERDFCGCDGEGCGKDEFGRQLYMLFRMGDRELFTGQPLRTHEILDFICDHPRDQILVGFAFGYDVTMILRDLAESQIKRLFQPKVFGQGHSPYVWFRDFDIDYLPRNYFRVKRVKIIKREDGSEQRIPIKGSQRTIYETFGFFQKSFLNSIKSFDVGKDHWDEIARQKARRSDFDTMGPEERAYCKLECEFLSDLMSKLRDYCHAAGIVPRTWSGAGKLAAALHKSNKTPEQDEFIGIPEEVWRYSDMAYYGGRFEITRTGQINQKVYEYDICSAYPDAMRKLPCLQHGSWHKANAKTLAKFEGLFVGCITFSHPFSSDECKFGRLGGFPVRTKEGHLNWPRMAGGIYWSPEIRSAERMGARVTYKDGWIFEPGCNCKPFDWVERLYDYRKSIGSQGAGYPIKLGINSLYGKLAQRKGNGLYKNMIWAGLITAMTRAKLMGAVALAPRGDIVMLATDGVYSLSPIEGLEIGDKLGQWEQNTLDDLFIVQPGLYWSPDKRKKKSRGLSGNFFEQADRTVRFENEFNVWAGKNANGLDETFPSVTVPVPGFIGLKLAQSRGKPKTAGMWTNDTRQISFDYRNKRQLHEHRDGHIITGIKPGSPGLLSLPHREFLKAGGAEAWEIAREVLEEQPDIIEFSNIFGD